MSSRGFWPPTPAPEVEHRLVGRAKEKRLIGMLFLSDEDAWACRNRQFNLCDFMPKSYTRVVTFRSGARCYDLDHLDLVAGAPDPAANSN